MSIFVRRGRPRRLGASAAILVPAGALLAGCSLMPDGADAERARHEEAGRAFLVPPEERALEPLPPTPDERALLRHAFLQNGELEAAWFEWQASLSRVLQASSWPNTNLAIGFSYLFSDERMKRFDRMTFSGGFDAMENLLWPGKVERAASLELERARAAAERFRAAKFALQERVLAAHAEHALAAERARLAREDLELLRVLEAGLAGEVDAGRGQEELLGNALRVRRAEDRLLDLEAEVRARAAALNAAIGRDVAARLDAPDALPSPRPLQDDDARLLEAVQRNNPELEGLRHEEAARGEALELARMQWIPDFNPTAAFTGSVTQSVGGVLVLPTSIAEIRGSIAAARSERAAAEAQLRQRRLERAAEVVAQLVLLRDDEREIEFLESTILPAARALEEGARAAFEAGAARLTPFVEARRTLVLLRVALAEARTRRAVRLARLEALCGFDVETLEPAATAVPAAPAPAPHSLATED